MIEEIKNMFFELNGIKAMRAWPISFDQYMVEAEDGNTYTITVEWN